MEKQHIAEMFNHCMLPVLHINSNMNILFYNPAFSSLVGECGGNFEQLPAYLQTALRDLFLNHTLSAFSLSSPEFPFDEISVLPQQLSDSTMLLIFLSTKIESIGKLCLMGNNGVAPLLSELENILEDEVKNRLLSQRRYQQLFHSEKNGIFLLATEDFSILESNNSALKMLDMESFTIPFPQLLPAAEQHEICSKLRALSELQIQTFTMNASLQNPYTKKCLPTELCAHLFVFNDQRNIYLTAHDISEHVALQKERDYSRALLQQQSKMASIGEMVAMIAHQWRQPLHTLMLECAYLLEIYKEGSLNPTEFEQFIAHIQKQLTFMNQTITDFQHFFSPSRKKTHFYLRDIVQNVCDLVEPFFIVRNTIRVFITEEENCKECLYGYANELKQVFLVIIQNARDILLQKGESFIGEIHIHISRDESSWHISIEDNGGGIQASALPFVFEPYFTTKEKDGNGIGLTTARMIIEQDFGGSITAKNGTLGALFEITLQRSLENAAL